MLRNYEPQLQEVDRNLWFGVGRSHVYVREDIPVEIRKAIAQEVAERLEIDNQFW